MNIPVTSHCYQAHCYQAHWYQGNLQYLFTAVNRLRWILQQYIKSQSEGVDVEYPPLPQPKITTAFDQLCNNFQLSPFEGDILLLCVGMEIDPHFETLCAEAQAPLNRPYPTVALALAACPQTSFRVFSSQSPLFKWQLIEMGTGVSFAQSPLRIDSRILCYLLGEQGLDPKLASLVHPISKDSTFLASSHQHLADQIVATWAQSVESRSMSVIQLIGTDRTTKQDIAAVACQQVGFRLVQMPGESLPSSTEECHQLIQRWSREAIITDSVLFLDCDEVNFGDAIRLASLTQFIDASNSLLIISTQERVRQRQRKQLIIYDVPPLTHEEQLTLWQAYLGERAADLSVHVETFVAQFNLSSATIQAACLQVKNQEDGKRELLATQLWNFCRIQARPHLDDLAQRIESKATWEDLVLPDREKQVLQDISTHLRHRAQVYQEWGFAKKGNRGLGISALFHGQSGTGKTLAAEVLAREFCLDLYRIDLSATVSKYIGETEKNLRRIFDTAEAGGAVLLFDEADAIFGKRSEVKDSHDRHANVEVAYLLQRMETYKGLAILTTNLKDSLDQAFIRRIRFMVAFPFPDVTARAEIWQRIFPSQTPTEGIDFSKLARLSIAGGNIRNIALNAAFLAADARQSVQMIHLLHAAQREYLKLGRSLTDSEIKGWV
jgi:AAA+ superfamily predicted ATPase